MGKRDGGDYGGRASIIDDTIQIVSTSPDGHTIESIYYFKIYELVSGEQTFNKFKFIY